MNRAPSFGSPLRVLSLTVASALGLATAGQAFTIFDPMDKASKGLPAGADGPSGDTPNRPR
jgi:hypothetical protein